MQTEISCLKSEKGRNLMRSGDFDPILYPFYNTVPTVQLIGPLWSSYMICKYAFQIPQWVLKVVTVTVKLFWKVSTNFIVHY